MMGARRQLLMEIQDQEMPCKANTSTSHMDATMASAGRSAPTGTTTGIITINIRRRAMATATQGSLMVTATGNVTMITTASTPAARASVTIERSCVRLFVYYSNSIGLKLQTFKV